MKTRKHLIASVILALSIATIYAQEHAILVEHRKLKNRSNLNLRDQNSRIIGEMKFDDDASPILLGTKKVPAINILVPGYDPITIGYLKSGETIVNLEKGIIATYGIPTKFHDEYLGVKQLAIYDLNGNLLALNDPLFYEVYHFVYSEQGALYMLGAIRGQKTYTLAKYNLEGILEWERDIPLFKVIDFKVSEIDQTLTIIQGGSSLGELPKVDTYQVRQLDFEGKLNFCYKKKSRLYNVLAIEGEKIICMNGEKNQFCLHDNRGKKLACLERNPQLSWFSTQQNKVSSYFPLLTTSRHLLIARISGDSIEVIKSFDLNTIGDFSPELSIDYFMYTGNGEFEILLSTYDLIILR